MILEDLSSSLPKLRVMAQQMRDFIIRVKEAIKTMSTKVEKVKKGGGDQCQ